MLAFFGERPIGARATASRASLYKYDSVELHFIEERLWAVHCEAAQDAGVLSLPVADHSAGDATFFTAGFATLYLWPTGVGLVRGVSGLMSNPSMHAGQAS